MIVGDGPFDYGLVGIEREDVFSKFTHAQDIDPTKREAELIRKYSDNGWTQDRMQRHVGRIPHIEFLKHPEWMHAPELIIKWLRSDEGAPYRTVTKGI